MIQNQGALRASSETSLILPLRREEVEHSRLYTGCQVAHIGSFLVPYRVKNDTIEVLAVFHGAQDWKAPLRARKDTPPE